MDLVVIGGGPGGYVAAIRAAQLGANVTLVEKSVLGGTCLNAGCIPTKVLLHGTELYQQVHKAGLYGIKVSSVGIDYGELQKQKNKIIKKLVGGIAGLLRANKVRVLNGTAYFLDRYHVRVKTSDGVELVRSDKAIIATGSQVARIAVPGVDTPCVITSDDALSFSQAPKSMVIIGGGVIGVELATVYARLGTKITIIEALEKILPNMEAELTGFIAKRLKGLGIDIYTSCFVSSIEPDGTVRFTGKDGEQSVRGEKVLMSVGRRPFTEGLGLEELGISMEHAAIKVDSTMRTNLANIYAVGDCTGGMMLAHVASEQGIVAVQNALQKGEVHYNSKTVPACVYVEPELASVGITEEQARRKYANIRIGRFDLAANGKAMLMGSSGVIKFVVNGDTGEILGLHILGPRATDIIAEGALAIRLKATIKDIVTTIHAHPTVGEAVAEAANDVRGLCIHKH